MMNLKLHNYEERIIKVGYTINIFYNIFRETGVQMHIKTGSDEQGLNSVKGVVHSENQQIWHELFIMRQMLFGL